MHELRKEEILELMRSQIRPAVGCTEPAAAAYAAALAAGALGFPAEDIVVYASANILKNAMGVGIPGTDRVGLPVAVALGAVGGDAQAGLACLQAVKEADVRTALALVEERRVHVNLQETDKKLYIDVQLTGGGHTARVVIEDAHTNVRCIQRDGQVLKSAPDQEAQGEAATVQELTLAQIDAFVRTVDWTELAFLDECIHMNEAIAREGLENACGLGVGRSVWEQTLDKAQPMDARTYALALTCAAADARMGGSMLPVMTSCGSGNQGLSATLPVIAAVRSMEKDRETLYRALAYSLLTTIHVKSHIGKLSPLCACSVGASIGTACALTYMGGGTLNQIEECVGNLIADVSGIICDGAKAGCSLKIATGVNSAFLCSMLALGGHAATALDGIVSTDVEKTIDNLGLLGSEGMADTDRVILGMLVGK